MNGRAPVAPTAAPRRPGARLHAAAPRRVTPLSVYIERLVLDGLPLARTDGARVQAALSAELGRLLGESGLGSALRHGSALDASRLQGLPLEPGIAPERLGEKLALALFRGLVL